jgi:hypothetical protein
MIFGGSPAAGTTVDVQMIRAIPNDYMQTSSAQLRRSSSPEKTSLPIEV